MGMPGDAPPEGEVAAGILVVPDIESMRTGDEHDPGVAPCGQRHPERFGVRPEGHHPPRRITLGRGTPDPVEHPPRSVEVARRADQ